MNTKQLQDLARPWLLLLDEIAQLVSEESDHPSLFALPVPQIVVFGDQSSGKSSLLEAISGVDGLFPKGSGLVTRCPTRISVIQCAAGGIWRARVSLSTARGISDDRRFGEDLFTPQELSMALKNASDALLSRSGAFSSECVQVTIESPTAPSLSLVDLPGIIRTTTQGQDRSIIHEVGALLDAYMQQPDTIILAVIPANQDIATVDVLERAARFDPTGNRTIGVLTKLDLVDQGAEEEVLQVALNRKKPLSLGFVAVRNRSQRELKAAVTLGRAVELEEEYFSTHAVWSSLPEERRGVASLCSRLTELIVSRALESGPRIRSLLERNRQCLSARLSAIGYPLAASDDVGKQRLVMEMISRFTETLRQIGFGEYREKETQEDTDMRVRFRISEEVRKLRSILSNSRPDFKDEEYRERLRASMQEMRGREMVGFAGSRQLLCSIAPELDIWREQVEETLNAVLAAMHRAAEKLAMQVSYAFPRVHEVLLECVREAYGESQGELQRRVEEMFVKNLQTVSRDQELVDSINQIRCERFEMALREVLYVAKETSGGGGTKEDLKAHVLDLLGPVYMEYHAVGFGVKHSSFHLEDSRAAVMAYWGICEQRIEEDVTSAIDVVILDKGTERIEKRLLSKAQEWLADQQTLEEVLSELPAVSEERTQLQAKLQRTQRCIGMLEEIIPNCSLERDGEVYLKADV